MIKVSRIFLKRLFNHTAFFLITLIFLSNTCLCLAQSAANRDATTQVPVSNVLPNKAAPLTGSAKTVQQKTTVLNKSSETVKQAPPQSTSSSPISSNIKSLINKFENFATKGINAFKTRSTTSSKKPVLPEPKNLPPIAKSQLSASSIKEAKPEVIEVMASLLVARPTVNAIAEGTRSLEVPLPAIEKAKAIVPASPTEVQSASDAMDELINVIGESTKLRNEIRDNEQGLTQSPTQKQVLEEEALKATEKQHLLLNNLKAQQVEPQERISLLDSIRNAPPLKKASIQPKVANASSAPESILDTLKNAMVTRRVALEEEEEGEGENQQLLAQVESIHQLPAKKITIDDEINNNIEKIKTIETKIASLKPTAESDTMVGYSNTVKKHNATRSQAIKEIAILNSELNLYKKNNKNLTLQKKNIEEEKQKIATKQEKFLSKLKIQQANPQSRENFLESIKKQANLKKIEQPSESVYENKDQEIKKQTKSSSGIINSLEKKMEEFKKQKIIAPHSSHEEENDWL